MIFAQNAGVRAGVARKPRRGKPARTYAAGPSDNRAVGQAAGAPSGEGGVGFGGVVGPSARMPSGLGVFPKAV